jgi:hypothetical protein
LPPKIEIIGLSESFFSRFTAFIGTIPANLFLGKFPDFRPFTAKWYKLTWVFAQPVEAIKEKA